MGASDVLLALEYVRDNDLPFVVKVSAIQSLNVTDNWSLQNAGHSVDAASSSTGVIIYLGHMRGVMVDPHTKLVWVQV